MQCCRPLQRRNKQTPFESHRWLGQSYFYGSSFRTGANPLMHRLAISDINSFRYRNSIFAIPNPLKRAFDILMSFTIWSAGHTQPSTAALSCVANSTTKARDSNNSITYRNFSYEDVHIDGLERIVDAVAKYDVDRFIHVSSYNADLNSPSEFFRTKVQHHNLL